MGRTDELVGLFDQVREDLGKDSLNYQVSIGLYFCANTAGKDIIAIIKAALGERALLGETYRTSPNDVLTAVIEGLTYEGDYGSHPDVGYLRSASGQQAIEEIARVLKEFLGQSGNIIAFRLEEGHPFYPVFWDYAYLIEMDNSAYVLIGSSSD